MVDRPRRCCGQGLAAGSAAPPAAPPGGRPLQHACRTPAPTPWPRPAHAFEGPQAHLAPEPPPVPAHAHARGRSSGQPHRGVLLGGRPYRHQRAQTAQLTGATGDSRSHPGLAWPWDQRPCGTPAPAQGLKPHGLLPPPHRRPAQLPQALPQARAPQPTVSQDQAPHGAGHSWPPQAQQAHQMRPPGARLVGRQHLPRHGDRTAAGEDAHRQHDDVFARGGGVEKAKSLACHHASPQRSRGAQHQQTSSGV
jgi:hypothetical protein